MERVNEPLNAAWEYANDQMMAEAAFPLESYGCEREGDV